MAAQWQRDFIGKMSINDTQKKITNKQLAEKLGNSETWVSDVLNRKRESKGSEEEFNRALSELIEENIKKSSRA